MSKPPRSAGMIRRRGFLAGLGAMLALPALGMPAIVRTPGLLMPISPVKPEVRAMVGKWRWGGFSNEMTDLFSPCSAEWQNIPADQRKPLALLPPSQLWGGAKGLMAEQLALTGDDPLAWQERELTKMFAEGVFA